MHVYHTEREEVRTPKKTKAFLRPEGSGTPTPSLGVEATERKSLLVGQMVLEGNSMKFNDGVSML